MMCQSSPSCKHNKFIAEETIIEYCFQNKYVYNLFQFYGRDSLVGIPTMLRTRWPMNQPSSRVESYVTTDGQSASLSGNKAPIWGLQPDFITVGQLRVCWCGALSLRRGHFCRLQLLIVLASAVILGAKSPGIRDHTWLSQIRDFPFGRLLRLAGLRWR
jgi:hypothetical protein